MNRFIKPDQRQATTMSIIMIVLGLLLLLWPGHVMTTALTILGIALLAGGIVSIVSWYRGRMRDVSFLTLAQGILLTVGGIVVLANPKFLISIVPLAVGVIVVINGIVNLAQALDQRRDGYDRWIVSLALAAGTLALGLLMVFNPFSTMEILVAAIGAVILYNGISNLWIDSRYRKL